MPVRKLMTFHDSFASITACVPVYSLRHIVGVHDGCVAGVFIPVAVLLRWMLCSV